MIIDVDSHRARTESRQSIIEDALSAGERHDQSCAGHRGSADLAEQNAVASEVDCRQTEAQIGKAVSCKSEACRR